jgi:hypothetical protein
MNGTQARIIYTLPNGKGMRITHIGKSVFHTPTRDFSFNNILHVSDSQKNLLSVHQFTSDNDVFLEFHPSFFCVKDLATEKLIFQGRCHDGLYPLPPISQVHHVSAPTASRWHYGLDHPSSTIVDRVIKDNKLSFHRESHDSIYDECERAKSHQLPYPRSSSVSSFPLQLIFSDVWGPAPKSVGHYQYYVSFIDDFSKFTWIFLLKNRFDVFDVFIQFQQLVE